MEAYLDIETSYDGDITVIGIYRGTGELVQLVGEDVCAERLSQALDGVSTIYTYNGSRFDLPVIAHQLNVDLARQFDCHDLMYDCWDNGLYGGLKKVETQLGIPRETQGIGGRDAMQLWQDCQQGNADALRTLLLYNSEDVVNLSILRMLLDLAGGQI
ncbi:MAG: ribonuclease H-like domain-containing protein [Dehalococcoidia bacterium]